MLYAACRYQQSTLFLAMAVNLAWLARSETFENLKGFPIL
jgi:hypothetical protein